MNKNNYFGKEPIEEFGKQYWECVSDCMQKAMEEAGPESEKWTPEELFKKGSNWAGRHVLITEKKND